jgi:NADPH-dependent 2,4-dienoyl-CoA reductase/sulfur reductase-like enzyme
MNRRDFLKLAGAASLASGTARAAGARVVVIGGGYGGATAARYLRLWDPSIEVVLVEREEAFVSCPVSNLVLGGFRALGELTLNYDGLRRRGVQVVRDEAVAIDAQKRAVRLGRGAELRYDRLIVSPGVDFLLDELPRYREAMDAGRILHAWKAGPQTTALRRQIEAMPDGGVFAISIPPTPYRCPPGPYERACVVAAYFRQAKPRAKVLVLDANPDVASKPALFKRAWAELYRDMIEYRPNSLATDVDADTMTLKLEVEDVRADLLNVLPPQRAGDIARSTGLITHNNRWCDVDWRTMESTAVPHVHVLGDATLSAPALPKSGSMAANQAKMCAAAVIELLNGRAPDPDPQLANTCYSYVSRTEAIHVASVHRWNEKEKTLTIVPGSGGVSAARSEAEGRYAWSWARNIWADMLS